MLHYRSTQQKLFFMCSNWHFSCRRWKSRNLPGEFQTDEVAPYDARFKNPMFRNSINILGWLHRKNITFKEIKSLVDWKRMEELKKLQRFIPERHRTLGPDLATAHFITFRGGKVKFIGIDKWLTYEHVESKVIPSMYVPNFHLEGIDASETEICYEGFDNLVNLVCLKKLFLRNCPHVDDWCLNRMHLLERTLEHLDISGCKNITERGICTLYKLRNLKKLVINDMPNVAHKELTALLLNDVLPACEIIGVRLDDPNLLNEITN